VSGRGQVRGLSLFERLYGALLVVFPAQFRQAYARDALELFRDRYREEYRRAQGRGVLLFWVRSAWDAIVSGVSTRWDRWRERGGSAPSARPDRGNGGRRRNPLSAIPGDVRYAFRSLSRTPGFTVVVVLTLAVGIGANTGIFSVVSGVLLQPLPFDNPGDLVAIWTRFTPESGYDFPKYPVGSPEYFDYVNQNRTMEQVAAVSSEQLALTDGTAEPEFVTAGYVSSSFFAVLRVPPLLGRTLIQADDGAHPRPVYVLSHDLWQRRFGGDSSVVGRALDVGLDNEQYGTRGEIVGVMPEGFAFPTRDVQLWTQLPLDPQRTWRGGHWFWMIGRLAPGVTYEQADAEMETLMAQWAIDYPDHHVGHGLFLTPLLRDMVGDVRPALLLLLGAVGFVLLIACANVANLMLARSEGRRRELGVRKALGAGCGRLVQQLLTESALLSVAGGALGILFSVAGVRVLLALEGGTVPRAQLIGLDARVLLFTGVVVLITTLVFGLAPALRAGATNLYEVFRDAATTVTAGRKRLRFRGFLLASEVAVAILLVIGAGLMTKSFWRLLSVDPGFRSENLLAVRFSLPSRSYSPSESVHFFADLTERVRALPDVESAAIVSDPPLLRNDVDGRFHIEGREGAAAGEFCCTGGEVTVGHGSFQTLGIELRRGRLIDETDLPDGPVVAVIDEELARRYWPNEDPIGKRIRFLMTDGPWATVVGVVANAKFYGLGESYPIYYHSYDQTVSWTGGFGARTMSLIVRTHGPPLAVAGPIRELVHAVDPDLPIVWMRTLDDIASASVARPRFLMTLLGAFAGVALVLAAIGVYGVISYGVARRAHEIGIRMALGAAAGSVAGMVVREGLALALIGVVVGLAAAVAVTRMMTAFLFNVQPTDLWTYTAVAGIILAVVVTASYLPARRASRVDPLTALRTE
jgi:putative ABC transport system permease protein